MLFLSHSGRSIPEQRRSAKTTRSTPASHAVRKASEVGLRLLLAGAIAGLAALSQRYLARGGATVRAVGTLISLPATLIGEGLRAIVYGLKALPGAITAKSAASIGKSAAFIGGGLLALEISSFPPLRVAGIGEPYGVHPIADKIVNRVSVKI